MASVAIAVAGREGSAPAFKYGAGAVANATGVKLSYTLVHVVADAIDIRILGAIATTDAQGVKLVAVAVTSALWDRSATAAPYRT